MRLTLTLLALALVWNSSALAQHQPYKDLTLREIKALSPEQVAGYRAGKGMGMALPAELNGYPGPKHVLELGEELSLTAAQRESVQAVFEKMAVAARRLGERIVDAERALDRAFADGSITPAQLEEATLEIGRLQGELRAAHLRAHLETRPLLSPEQLAAYAAARGYHEPPAHRHGG